MSKKSVGTIRIVGYGIRDGKVMLFPMVVYRLSMLPCILCIVYSLYHNTNKYIVFSNILYTFAHNIKVTNYEYCSSSDKKKEH